MLTSAIWRPKTVVSLGLLIDLTLINDDKLEELTFTIFGPPDNQLYRLSEVTMGSEVSIEREAVDFLPFLDFETSQKSMLTDRFANGL